MILPCDSPPSRLLISKFGIYTAFLSAGCSKDIGDSLGVFIESMGVLGTSSSIIYSLFSSPHPWGGYSCYISCCSAMLIKISCCVSRSSLRNSRAVIAMFAARRISWMLAMCWASVTASPCRAIPGDSLASSPYYSDYIYMCDSESSSSIPRNS